MAQFKTKVTPFSVKILFNLFIYPINKLNFYRFQKKLNEDIPKSSSISSSFINCTNTISYKSTSVSSNHLKGNNIK